MFGESEHLRRKFKDGMPLTKNNAKKPCDSKEGSEKHVKTTGMNGCGQALASSVLAGVALILLLFANDLNAQGLPDTDSPPSRFGRDFLSKTLDRFPPETFNHLLLGRFLGQPCSESLARSSKDGSFWLVEGSKEAVQLRGLASDFPLVDSVAVDINADGRSDLLGYLPERSKWMIAFAQPDNHFVMREMDLPFLNPSPRRPMPLGEGKFFRVFVNSPKQIHFLAYAHERGLFELHAERTETSNPVVGVLRGSVEAGSRTGALPNIRRFNWMPESLMRNKPPEMFVWAQFPEGVSSDGALFGDFDGNGFTDALVRGWNFERWWIAQGRPGISAAEYPVDGLEKFPSRGDEITVGDVDCDGRDDLAVRTIRGGKMEIALSRIVKEEDDERGKQLAGRALSSHEGPFVCVGYLPLARKHKWGEVSECPPNYAVISTLRDSRQQVDACCRLPHPDILTERRIFTPGPCPEDSIVTGFEYPSMFQCTTVNTDRYRLVGDAKGVHWGFGRARHEEEYSIQKTDIPISFRGALGRKSFQHWDHEGCVGYPWGALLVSRSHGGCGSEQYRRLVYRGIEGDPKAGTPVAMFPECVSGVNAFDPNAGCTVKSLPRVDTEPEQVH